MNKTLSDRVLESFLCSDKNTREKDYCPLVLALWEEINSALEKRCPVKKIWQLLHDEGKYPASYNSFRSNIKKIQNEKKDSITPDKINRTSPQKEANSVVVSGKFVSSELPTFNMDAVGSKEDLF